MKKLLYIGALSALLLVACSEEEPIESTNEPVALAEEVPTEKVEETPTITLDAFETAYKDKLTMAFMPSTREQVADNRYSVALDSDIFMMMDYEGDIVQKATVAAVTDSFDDRKQKIKIAFDALVKTSDETLTDTQIDKLYSDLNITWDLAMLDQTQVKSLNNVKYTYKADNSTGSVILQTELK